MISPFLYWLRNKRNKRIAEREEKKRQALMRQRDINCGKGRGTLICYAGSASEASIGSRPLGSELVVDMVIIWLGSQGTPRREKHLAFRHMDGMLMEATHSALAAECGRDWV